MNPIKASQRKARPSPVLLRRVLPGDVPTLKAVEEIYLASFEEAERVPWERVLDILLPHRRAVENALFILYQRRAVLGFALCEINLDLHSAYFPYLAVHPDQRDRGLGHILMQELEKNLRRRWAEEVDTLTLEIESAPADLPPDAILDQAHRLRVRRRRFYESCGFTALDGLRFDLYPGTDYLLMAKPLQGQAPGRALWETCIQAIAQGDWYAASPDHPRLCEIMARFKALSLPEN